MIPKPQGARKGKNFNDLPRFQWLPSLSATIRDDGRGKIRSDVPGCDTSHNDGRDHHLYKVGLGTGRGHGRDWHG